MLIFNSVFSIWWPIFILVEMYKKEETDEEKTIFLKNPIT